MISTLTPALLQSNPSDTANALFGGIGLLVWLVLVVVVVIGFWKVFTKAGQPGWAVLIPIYNLYVMLKIAGRPGWWLVLFLIPIVNIVVAAILAIDIAHAFGKSTLFGLVMLFILSGLGYLVLGFGSATYRGPEAS